MENITREAHIAELAKRSEARYIDYKKQLEFVFKNKDMFAGELGDWYKDFLREMKNLAEGNTKELKLELTHLRQGMNEPFYYKF